MTILRHKNRLDLTPRPLDAPRARVLVAEDDEAFASLLLDVLVADGHDVDYVDSGLGLFDALSHRERNGPYDLVVSDVRMPGLSGLHVLSLTEDDVGRPDMILITAFPSESVELSARKHGAVHLLGKPFEMATLRQLVRGVVAQRRATG